MTRDPAATRDRLLDAFAELVASTGARSATLEAVAAAAGVSKGGLLYHFGSKDALVDGLLGRMAALAAHDLARMRTAPEGAAEYYVRTSAVEGGAMSADVALSRSIIAALRLAQEGDQRAVAAYAGVIGAWRQAIEEQVRDPVLARVVQLVGDGLWASSSMGVPTPDLADVLARVRALVEDARRAGASRHADGRS
ncbi:TetR family transcriptional regulator [Kineococcus sp. T13]|uniref:TetR family transcriptional regulator n=1 Tax=Kineococcus vitellinus TaxID=2696565 RepID=UPI001412C0CE|nr:TetR family transcriptional regulator [Kineococcus vitellinus]